MSLPGLRVPDGIEPIVGWRYWGCETPGGETAWLTSINRFSTWPAGRATKARCSYAPIHGPEVPHESCTCGVYAVSDLETLKEVADPIEGAAGEGRRVVVGTVAIWGRIVPGEWGWRGEHAYPTQLWVVRETVPPGDEALVLAAELEGAYRVPAEVCDAAWALPHDVRPPRDADTVALAAAAWDLSHSLDRLASAAASAAPPTRKSSAGSSRRPVSTGGASVLPGVLRSRSHQRRENPEHEEGLEDEAHGQTHQPRTCDCGVIGGTRLRERTPFARAAPGREEARR